MAVVGEAEVVWDGWRASAKWGGATEFTVVYEITVDSALDGPNIVASAAGLPRLGHTYSAGNESSGQVVCDSLGINRKKDLLWRVTCVYRPHHSAGVNAVPIYASRDARGRPTDDPMEAVLPFRTGHYKRLIPVEKAYNVNRFKGRFVNTPGPVTNSAHEVLNPPIERDYSIMVIYAGARTLSVPDFIVPDYYDAVNEDSVVLERLGFRLEIEPYHAKIDSLDLTYMMQNNRTFWEWSVVIAIDHVFGWRPEVLDRGFMARAMVGDPDGHGGIISFGDVVEGQPEVRVIEDIHGQPVRAPVLLDGDGQPLKAGEDPVYLQWIVLPEMSFENLINTLHLYE